jgi:hypothetical protein
VVHLNKDLQKSLTTSRRLLESRESFVACPYLCDILYNRLLYVSPDPKERAARSLYQLYTYAPAPIAEEKTALEKKAVLQVSSNGGTKKIYDRMLGGLHSIHVLRLTTGIGQRHGLWSSQCAAHTCSLLSAYLHGRRPTRSE